MSQTLNAKLAELAGGIVHLLHMASTARRTRGFSETISSFPDELLCQVLKRLDLTTKIQAHTVCRQWNNILSDPCCADLWTVVPKKTMAGRKLTTQSQDDIEQYTQWLAARATGVPRADIVTKQWTSPEPGSSVYTEARCFVVFAVFAGLLALSHQATRYCLDSR